MLQPVEYRMMQGSVVDLYVQNRLQIARFAPHVPHITISVETPNAPPLEIVPSPYRKALLSLEFDDLTDDHRAHFTPEELTFDRPAVFFSREHALQIADFVRKYLNEIDAVVCQCEGGQSRSRAIALALHSHCNRDLSAQPPEMRGANTLVYDILTDVLK